MGDVVNLKRFRKRTERDQADEKAKINRARFGQTKHDRERQTEQAGRAEKRLDQHRLPTRDDR